jgi:hypothetical protein
VRWVDVRLRLHIYSWGARIIACPGRSRFPLMLPAYVMMLEEGLVALHLSSPVR